MAKISPVSIKYMIVAKFVAEGALEKPDVIGAIFGQTEGLLGSGLEMRELQKEGKIGRIEVDLERNDKKTSGKIYIPTALDQSETALIAAAIETIERIGPSDAQIEVERIEDVRGSKRDYIVDRAKKLMSEIEGVRDSREISETVKSSMRLSKLQEYGKEKLPCGNISGNEIIVVEGRADVITLIKSGVENVIAMSGTKMPEAIKKLSNDKEITLFVDGDRGGRLIIKNVLDNAKIDYIIIAPDGKEVEELTPKEVLSTLRKKISTSEFLARERQREKYNDWRDKKERTEHFAERKEREEPKKSETKQAIEVSGEMKEKLREISNKLEGTKKAVILDESLEEIKKLSSKTLAGSLRRMKKKPFAIIIDGVATNSIIRVAEENNCQIIVAKNFASTSSKVSLLSL